MSSAENKKYATDKKEKLPKIECIDGFKNYLVVMVSVFALILVLENYSRFGIVKGPFEIVICVIKLILQHWWLFFATLTCFCVQIAQTFLLENLLAMEILSENKGMSLHALNVFFLPTTFIVIARTTAANPIVTRVIMTYILYVMTKVWSYAYVNSTYRTITRRKNTKLQNEGEAPSVKYPSNVTVRNLIEYFVFTPPVQYQVSYPNRTAPDWILFAKLCLRLFLIYCIIAVLLIQFLLPELSVSKNEGNGFIPTFRCVLRVMLPVNLLWIISIYVHVYETYLPAYAALTGMKNVAFCKDWWNCNSISMFWRQWNLPVHECLKYNVALPLLRNGYSKISTNFVVFIIAGILHEYLNTFPFGIHNGLALLCTLLEIPIGHVSVAIAKKFGNRFGNLFFWMFMVSIHCSTILQTSNAYNIQRWEI